MTIRRARNGVLCKGWLINLSGGKASVTTSTLAVGSTTVTATYNGTANIQGSAGSVVQVVN